MVLNTYFDNRVCISTPGKFNADMSKDMMLKGEEGFGWGAIEVCHNFNIWAAFLMNEVQMRGGYCMRQCSCLFFSIAERLI